MYLFQSGGILHCKWVETSDIGVSCVVLVSMTFCAHCDCIATFRALYRWLPYKGRVSYAHLRDITSVKPVGVYVQDCGTPVTQRKEQSMISTLNCSVVISRHVKEGKMRSTCAQCLTVSAECR